MNEHFQDEHLERMVGPGWHPLVKVLRDYCNQVGVQILQVKEKFGGLRFYVAGHNHPELDLMIRGAEDQSTVTCEDCGQWGAKIAAVPPSNYWLKCLCKACRDLRTAAQPAA